MVELSRDARLVYVLLIGFSQLTPNPAVAVSPTVGLFRGRNPPCHPQQTFKLISTDARQPDKHDYPALHKLEQQGWIKAEWKLEPMRGWVITHMVTPLSY
jgi:hypothetical protein